MHYASGIRRLVGAGGRGWRSGLDMRVSDSFRFACADAHVAYSAPAVVLKSHKEFAMAASPSLTVKCKPYFKLRSKTPHIRSKINRFSRIGRAARALDDAISLRRLQLADGSPRPMASSPSWSWAAAGCSPTWTRSSNGLNQPTPQITDVSVDGTQNSPNQSVGSSNDPDYEVALDIQVAGASFFAATARPATIRVYWSQDIASAVQMAANDGCDVCSISWGADEAVWGTAAAQQMEQAAAAATAAGMVDLRRGRG